jgi:hypothetical protein
LLILSAVLLRKSNSAILEDKRMRTAIVMLAMVMVFVAAADVWAVADYTVVSDTGTHHYWADLSGLSVSRVYLATGSGNPNGGVTLPSFSADFSQTFGFCLSAPPNKTFDVLMPEGSEQGQLTISLATGSSVLNNHYGSVVSYGFQGIEGTEPSAPEYLLIGDNDSDFSLNVYFDLTGDVSFTSLTVEVEIPDFDFTYTNQDFFEESFISIEAYGVDMSDPGEWVTIVPEPATLLLFGLGAVMVRRRERRNFTTLNLAVT